MADRLQQREASPGAPNVVLEQPAEAAVLRWSKNRRSPTWQAYARKNEATTVLSEANEVVRVFP